MSNRVYQTFEISTPFLRGYKELRIPIVNADGISAWPELFPLEKIEEMREIVGPRHFSSQMMLDYVSEEKVRLDPGALHFYDDNFDRITAKLGDNLITGAAVYWDPSGGRVHSDSSVCILIYRDDKNRRVFIQDVKYLTVNDNDIHPMATQCESVLNFMKIHNQKKIAIEVNGIGNSLPEILRETANKLGQPIIVQGIVNHKRKETRILESIEPMLATGRLYSHEKIKSTPLLSEMLGWSPMAVSQNDDGLDALAGAMRIQPIPIRTISGTFRVLKAKTDFKV
ncbi:MAG: hypothetical protein JW974_01135 [Alphaproteobacteria bacterium]|nr:hypothetical protein [Alphaproteobacteria bacterium]MBN2675391.1 hypothetical protein [Alphaproteobacteria bacterium]